MLAAILCGSTGIAGGMVLGPLMLAYNMLPQVMSGTNQYITMVASISTVLQFIVMNELLVGYALLYGSITTLAALTGIKAINVYLAKSGRQSIITIIMTLVLCIAFGTLPLKYLIAA